MQATIGGKLRQDSAITHVVTQAEMATFGLSPYVVTTFQNGDIAFSMDQQSYLQGYLAVHALSLNLSNGRTSAAASRCSPGPPS